MVVTVEHTAITLLQTQLLEVLHSAGEVYVVGQTCIDLVVHLVYHVAEPHHLACSSQLIYAVDGLLVLGIHLAAHGAEALVPCVRRCHRCLVVAVCHCAACTGTVATQVTVGIHHLVVVPGNRCSVGAKSLIPYRSIALAAIHNEAQLTGTNHVGADGARYVGRQIVLIVVCTIASRDDCRCLTAAEAVVPAVGYHAGSPAVSHLGAYITLPSRDTCCVTECLDAACAEAAGDVGHVASIGITDDTSGCEVACTIAAHIAHSAHIGDVCGKVACGMTYQTTCTLSASHRA